MIHLTNAILFAVITLFSGQSNMGIKLNFTTLTRINSSFWLFTNSRVDIFILQYESKNAKNITTE